VKVCIVGAGAIGGLIGARLAAAKVACVSAVARGATLAALRTHGWRLEQGDERIQVGTHASDRPADLGVQDLVLIAVKGPALTQVAREIAPLLGAGTVVLPAMNGVPWWFGEGVPALAGVRLDSVDPGGVIAAAIPRAQVVGCVVHASAFVAEPGRVVHRTGRGLILGEPAGAASERIRRLVDLLVRAGFEATPSDAIRRDIWYKLWGNMTINPVSAITGATTDRILADDLVLAFCSDAMREAAAIGARIDCPIDQVPADRHAITRRLGAFKSSMLQDVEAGRAIELDAIIGVVHELGRRLAVPTPRIDALLGLARLFGRVHGLYPES
jgi:2-dehydropantoate 2-reductase